MSALPHSADARRLLPQVGADRRPRTIADLGTRLLGLASVAAMLHHAELARAMTRTTVPTDEADRHESLEAPATVRAPDDRTPGGGQGP